MDFERPITRWRREKRPFSRTDIESERPSSRRSNVISGNSINEKPRVITRPPSNTVYTSRSGSSLSPSTMQPERTPMLIHSRRDRPISQQGLGGLRTSTSKAINFRQIQDQRYFQGLLKVKISHLITEMTGLRKQIEVYSRERASFLIYDKRVKETAAELTDVQRKLGNYNLAMDKINTGTDIPKILQEAKELDAINTAEVAAVEHLFSDRKRREETVTQLELQLQKEKCKADELVAGMGPQMREQYDKAINKKFEVENKMEHLKTQLKSLNTTKAMLNKQLSLSPVKAEVVRLEIRLLEMKTKADGQLKNKKSDLSPELERDSLLAKVKHDNSNIISMERAIQEVKERIKHAYETLSQKEHAPNNTTRLFKYSEWRNRQKSIESYLSSAEMSKKEELSKLNAIETEILVILKELSVSLAILPTVADYKSLEENELNFKTDILNTAKSLTAERNNLSLYLCKVEIMDKEVNSELINLKNKLSKMSAEMITFTDLEGLKKSVENKEFKLTEIRNNLEEKRPHMIATLRDTITRYNELRQTLLEDERNTQLVYLEKKLSVIEQSNFSLMDYIPSSIQKKYIDTVFNKLIILQKKLNVHIKNNVPD